MIDTPNELSSDLKKTEKRLMVGRKTNNQAIQRKSVSRRPIVFILFTICKKMDDSFPILFFVQSFHVRLVMSAEGNQTVKLEDLFHLDNKGGENTVKFFKIFFK